MTSVLRVPGRDVGVVDGEVDLDFIDRRIGYLFVKFDCTDDCVLTTVDAGRTWRPAALPALTSMSNGAGVVYALTAATEHRRQHVFRSRAGSAHWTRLGVKAGTVDRSADVATSSDAVALLRTGDDGPHPVRLGRLLVSEDRGHRFVRRANPCTAADGGAALISITRNDPQRLMLDCYNGEQSSQETSTQHHLYGSSDGGRTWRRLADPTDTGRPADLVDNGRSAFLSTYGGAGYQLRATTDAAERWHGALTGSAGEFDLGDLRFVSSRIGFALAPTHYAPEKLFETVDRGRTWHRISTPTQRENSR
jgi:photosystem II stability/assembly factor-like uncharacterized protein